MCVFCEIIAGNIPSAKVYEDDRVLAILDISQATKGHTLVIPKKHYETILDMPQDEFSDLMRTVHSLADKIVSRLNASGCNILINTGEAAGQTVKHAHVHIIPRYSQDDDIGIQFTEHKLDLNEVLNQIQ